MEGKIVLLLAIAAAVTVSGLELSERAKEIIVECKNLHNIELPKLLEAVEKHSLPTTENGKCFMECVMTKGGVISGGQVVVEKAHQLASKKLAGKPEMKEKVYQVIDKCASEVSNPGGNCEFGPALGACALKYGRELGIPAPIMAF
uniref:Odorant-binding protein 20 n=1 Tax=Yemma signatus TaxID=300820 RepID=A0A3G2GRS7_9HEMI|nr:odorant-binding protein 20 [Yemma signatus]